MEQYTVYWYKRDTHTNPFTEGYIGITKNMTRRNIEHLGNKKVSHFTNALKLYNDITYTILYESITLDEASDLEYAYRSLPNIGWNSAIGGIDTLGTMTTPVTLYHETDPDKIYSYTSITKAAEELSISRARISQAILRKRQIYGYDGWAVVIDETFDRALTRNVSQLRSESLKGMPKSKPSIFKGKTNRWSDKDKARISAQHKGKIISEEQRKTVSEKNKANRSLCKQVMLKHIDADTTYTYYSIAEASRQLGLPLSRLKSKAQRPLNQYGKDGWAITHLGS